MCFQLGKALVGTLSVIVKTSRTLVCSSTRHIHSGSGTGSTPPLVKLYSPPMFIFPLPPHYGWGVKWAQSIYLMSYLVRYWGGMEDNTEEISSSEKTFSEITILSNTSPCQLCAGSWAGWSMRRQHGFDNNLINSNLHSEQRRAESTNNVYSHYSLTPATLTSVSACIRATAIKF